MTSYTKHPTSTCKAILRRLRSLGCEIPGPDSAWCVRRTFAGTHQRSAGALSWTLELVDYSSSTDEQQRQNNVYGGYWPAGLCSMVGATIGDERYYSVLEPPKHALDRLTSRLTGR